MRGFGTEISGNRKPNQELSEAQRAGIIGQKQAGDSTKKIATEYGIHRNTVSQTLKRFRDHKTPSSLPRSGRPEKLSRSAKQRLFRAARKSPRIQYAALRSHAPGNKVCRRTIYSILKKRGLTNWRAKKRPKLSREDAEKRLEFARNMRSFNWRKVIFSDECSVERGAGKDAVWVFRHDQEKWNPEMIEPKDKRHEIRQMVWASFWYNEQSELVIMERDYEADRQGYSSVSYTEALKEGLLPIYDAGDPFVQDNAPIHKSYFTQEFFESHGIWVLDWPANSPDLNPIEHLWWSLKKMVLKLHPELENMGNSKADWRALRDAIREAWNRLPVALFRQLVDSMPRRLAAVRKSRGWQTKY